MRHLNTLFGLALAAWLAAPAPAPAKDELTLRVNDAIGEPGGLVAVVLRTYASRPLGQGQVCFLARGRSAARSLPGPFAELEKAKVFSKKGDGLSAVTLEQSADGQVFVLQFSSETATINRQDGPLAVLYFRLRQDLEPRQRFQVEIDLGNTILFDPQGNVVPVEPRAGELRVRRPSDPYLAEAEGDEVRPGETAELGVETFEPVAMGAGQVGFRFDPNVAAGRARVKMKRRHGQRKFQVDRSTPGLVLVTFQSRRGNWNLLPGEIISIKLPTSPGVPAGTRSRVSLDRSLTFFEDPEGDLLPFELEDNELDFESGRDDDD